MLLIFRKTLGDNVDNGHPGHQVPCGALPHRYSCSRTAKTPESLVLSYYVLNFHKNSRDNVILSTLGTRYLGVRYHHDSRVSRLQKLPSYKFRLIVFQIAIKLQETMLILSTLGTRYLGDRSRRHIRVQRYQKLPSNEFLIAMLQFTIKLSEMTFMRSILGTRSSEVVAVAISVFSNPKNP
ncbi:hypothetical protein TSAR_013720 [Trichomalopsis sarcophagae]|uniref:Uncharacterized protein n=1 Tax=Trichomalopsis sarcophagae TaxID=543379 RepID=A0A232FA14_9HYME|nr:hypothetical protein TSAR_013720 [Trichomalopsis sarcophagae]